MTSREPRETGELERLLRQLNRSRAYELKAQVGDRLEVDLYEPSDDEDRTLVEETSDGERVVEFVYEDGIKPKVLVLRKMNRRARTAMVIDLAMYTEQELLCLRDAITRAVELVLPTATQADRQAKEKMQREGIANARLYRPVPTIRGRDGSVAVYVEGVQQ